MCLLRGLTHLTALFVKCLFSSTLTFASAQRWNVLGSAANITKIIIASVCRGEKSFHKSSDRQQRKSEHPSAYSRVEWSYFCPTIVRTTIWYHTDGGATLLWPFLTMNMRPAMFHIEREFSRLCGEMLVRDTWSHCFQFMLTHSFGFRLSRWKHILELGSRSFLLPEEVDATRRKSRRSFPKGLHFFVRLHRESPTKCVTDNILPYNHYHHHNRIYH